MLILLLYVLIGFVAIFAISVIHVIRAELKGFEAIKFWSEQDLDFLKHSGGWLLLIFGLLIWPVRFIQAIGEFQQYYELYELK